MSKHAKDLTKIKNKILNEYKESLQLYVYQLYKLDITITVPEFGQMGKP